MLDTRSFGPFAKGVVDGYNSSLDVQGALLFARNAYADGIGRILARPGAAVAMTLKDDQGSPASVTRVVAIVPFEDGALAVAHSTITSKFYLYRFDADLSGWFNSGGAFQANLNAQPVGVLWTGAASPAKVLIAEGLGRAFIAHNEASNTFKSRIYDVATGLVDLKADLEGVATAKVTYFRGFVSFQQHLWGWGYGSEAAGDNARAELLRFGIPNFASVTVGADQGHFLQPDLFTVGHRVRSARERIVGGVVAGDILYIGTAFSLWPVTGFGRNSWDKSRPLDESYGFAGQYAAVDANGILYYWSNRGPMRAVGLAKPEPLWERLSVATKTVTFAGDIIATFDPDRDQVIFLYRNQVSGRVSVLAAVDTVRDIILGPDGDIGLGIACAGLVQTGFAPGGGAGGGGFLGPAAPPTAPVTTNIGSNSATGSVTPGDTTPGTTTIWEIRKVGESGWTVAGETAPAGPFQFIGLLSQQQYEWRAKHLKNGQSSTYVGPVPATTFTTAGALIAPTNCALEYIAGPQYLKTTWTNSGEAGVSTEIWHEKNSTGFVLIGTVGPGSASHFRAIGSQTGLFVAKVRHIKTGFIASPYSNTAQKTV